MTNKATHQISGQCRKPTAIHGCDHRDKQHKHGQHAGSQQTEQHIQSASKNEVDKVNGFATQLVGKSGPAEAAGNVKDRDQTDKARAD